MADTEQSAASPARPTFFARNATGLVREIRAHPESIDADIERHEEELRYECVDRPNPMHPLPHRCIYRVHRPFTIHQRKVRSGEDNVEVSFSPVCLVSAAESTGFLIVARHVPLDPAEEARRYQLDVLIQAQDQRIVEAQRPEELPIDLAAELHIKGPDAVAVAYRRLLAGLGADAEATAGPADAPPAGQPR
jgi:hypothetical protein